MLESTMKVRFHDCDPFNHLNNSRYIDYAIMARGDQLLDNYDLDIYRLGTNQGLGWVTAQTQISYLFPAYLNEEVVIQTQLLAYSDKSLHIEATIWDKFKTKLKAILWVRFVHYNLVTQKSEVHGASLMSLFEEIVNPVFANSNFDERVQQLRYTK